VTTTVTSRVGSAPTADNTKRVATTGAVPASGGGPGNSTWGGSWGLSWGFTWYNVSVAGGATPASPAIDVTQRITAAATANNTKRVTL
jgi:hypothetical protein